MARVTPLQSTVRDQIPLEGSRCLRLGETIGRGNAGVVYRALLESEGRVKRPVAVKLFDVVPYDEREAVLPRIERLARHAAFVQHPNVVETYEYGVTSSGAQPYLVTQLVEGMSLEQLLEAYATTQRRPPLDLALFIALEVAEALVAARRATTLEGRRVGFAHGDLSAREVLLSWNGEVKVSDFGVARAIGFTSAVRRIATLARRVATVAPEVAQGEKDDPRSDVFSLGVLLHEMLVGPRFPTGMSDGDKLEYARAGHVHTTAFGPQLPDALRDVLLGAIAVEPERRFPHAGVVAYDLRRAAMEMGVGDGRVFLRNAMQNILDQTRAEDFGGETEESTDEHAMNAPANDAELPRFLEDDGETA